MQKGGVLGVSWPTEQASVSPWHQPLLMMNDGDNIHNRCRRQSVPGGPGTVLSSCVTSDIP